MLKNIPIKTAIKIKPKQHKTISSGINYLFKQQNKNQIRCLFKHQNQNKNLRNKQIQVSVNEIYDSNTSKKSPFQDFNIESMIDKFCDGYNTTIIAYGQTGSGKTYLMQGTSLLQKEKLQNKNKPLEIGIIQKSIFHIFNIKNQNRLISASYIQIYDEKIYDLINDKNMEHPLKLKWDIQRQFILQNVQQKICEDSKQMIYFLNKGRQNRKICENKINQLSSRSHSLFIIQLEDVDNEGNYRNRFLTFVDLAGSQKISEGQQKICKQAIKINQSLFFLKKVILALQTKMETTTSNSFDKQIQKPIYVPYRDSKLTCLLKRSLGGDCLTLIIGCISPQIKNFDESVSTLAYVVKANNIYNQPSIQYDKKAKQINILKQSNQKLKRQLQIANKQINCFKNLFKNQNKKDAQFNSQLIQCISTVRELLKSNKQLRQQIEDQKKKSKQYLYEIYDLMRVNQDYKNTLRTQSLSIQKFKINQMNSSKIDSFKLQINPIQHRKYSVQSSPYLSSPSKSQQLNEDRMNRTQSFKSVQKFRKKIKFKDSVLRKKTFKMIEDFNNEDIKL